MKANTAIYRAGLTFATGITCGALAYAVREQPALVFGFVTICAFLMAILTLAKDET